MGPKKNGPIAGLANPRGRHELLIFPFFFRFNSHGQVRSLYIPVMTSQKRLIVGWNLHEYTN